MKVICSNLTFTTQNISGLTQGVPQIPACTVASEAYHDWSGEAAGA